MEHECLAPILFETALTLTYYISILKVLKKQAARFLAFHELPHFMVIRGNLSLGME